MARSDHHGCKPRCGVCHPTKRWKHAIPRTKRLKPADQRKIDPRAA